MEDEKTNEKRGEGKLEDNQIPEEVKKNREKKDVENGIKNKEKKREK